MIQEPLTKDNYVVQRLYVQYHSLVC